MRILGLAFVLLGAFLSFARAQPVASDPGDYLLRAVKAVVDSGRAYDPGTVAPLLHMSFTETSHGVMGANGGGECPGGGHRIDDGYAVTGNNWFHSLPTGQQHMIIQVPFLSDIPIPPNAPPSYGKQTETVLGDPGIGYSSIGVLRCANVNQNSLYVSLTFNNIPSYACISEAQIKAVFPEGSSPAFAPGPFERKPDFVYSNAGTSVQFEMTLYPGVPDPHHQPVCLMDISIGSRFQYGPKIGPDLSFTPPVPFDTGTAFSSASNRTPQPDSGVYLLRAVKFVADSGRIDDPEIVSKMLHLSLSAGDYGNTIDLSCSTQPRGQSYVSLDYLMTGQTWFHPLPTGKRVLVKGFPNIFAVKLADIPIGDPAFSYNVGGQVGCTKSSADGIGALIIFDDIPPYACISTAQIKAIFPSAHPRTIGPRLYWGDLGYSNDGADLQYTDDNANVDFTMTSSARPGVPANQPECLKTIGIDAFYPFGGSHRLRIENWIIDDEQGSLHPSSDELPTF